MNANKSEMIGEIIKNWNNTEPVDIAYCQTKGKQIVSSYYIPIARHYYY